MNQRAKKKANLQRREEEEVNSNWSELCPDLLQFIVERLSFQDLNRARSVCSSWNSALRGCVPKKYQIPWLILFPSYTFSRNNNNSGSCVLFVPHDTDKVYKTRDFGVNFFMSRCLATYGSWLLIIDHPSKYNLYLLNPLTGERIDLPKTKCKGVELERACFWIDNITKDYLVVLIMMESIVFTKNGDNNKWQEFSGVVDRYDKTIYNHKNQKLYVYCLDTGLIKIWDFSRDKPRKEGFIEFLRVDRIIERYVVVTISGDVLVLACCLKEDYKRLRFRIFKANHVTRELVEMDSLGDEALIVDMGATVVAQDVPGIKRNSIYFSGFDDQRNNPKNIFVYDLTTQNMEPLPLFVSSSIKFSDSRWFFPGFNG